MKTCNQTELNKVLLKDIAIACSWNLKVGGAKIEKAPKVMATSWNLKLKCGPDFLRAFFSNRKPLSVRRSKVLSAVLLFYDVIVSKIFLNIEKASKVMATSWNLKLKCGPDFLRAFFSNRKPLSVRRSKVFIGGAALLRCDRFKESLTELRRVSLFLIGVISSTPISNIVNLIRLVRATRAWGVCASQQRPKNK